jgi:hypothetical protein
MLNSKQKRYCISKSQPLPKQVSNGTHAIDHELVIESLTVGAFLLVACVLLLGGRFGKTTVLTIYGRLAQCVIIESGHAVAYIIGCGTVLQAGRSWVQLLMRPSDFSSVLWPWGELSL